MEHEDENKTGPGSAGALLCMLALSLPGMAEGRFVYDSGNA